MPERSQDEGASLLQPATGSSPPGAVAGRRLIERRDAHGGLIESAELEDGVAHGPIRHVRPDGSGEVAIEMQRGFATGALHDRDRTGLPRARLRLDRGIAHGPAELFKDGRPFVTMVLNKGVPDGEVRIFDAKGELASVVPFSGGVIDGLLRLYGGDGRIARSSAMRGGVLHGWTTEHAKDGEVASRQWFENGQPAEPPEPNGGARAGPASPSASQRPPTPYDQEHAEIAGPPLGFRLRRWLDR